MQAATKVVRRDATAASGDSVAVLAFSGDIASTSKDTMLQAYHGVGEVKKVLLDFSGVDYINSSGISIIIQMLIEERAAGHRTIGIFGLTAALQKGLHHGRRCQVRNYLAGRTDRTRGDVTKPARRHRAINSFLQDCDRRWKPASLDSATYA